MPIPARIWSASTSGSGSPGTLIADAALAALLAEVLDAAETAGISASFFEVTTAAAFLAFARTPADACVIEVGLGGRLDATNVIPAPIVCGIASLGIDHEAFLLAPEAGTPRRPARPDRVRKGRDRQARRAAGDAGLPRRARPPPSIAQARAASAPLFVREGEWQAEVTGNALHYSDAQGAFDLPLPTLAGAHQADNAALAVAMLAASGGTRCPLARARARHPQCALAGPVTAACAGPLTARAG